jgi:hypothetical protein
MKKTLTNGIDFPFDHEIMNELFNKARIDIECAIGMAEQIEDAEQIRIFRQQLYSMTGYADRIIKSLPRTGIEVIAIETGHMGTAFNNDEDYYYWTVEYIDLRTGDILDDLTLKGERYREVDYQYDEFLSDEENHRLWEEARDREYREHIQAIVKNASSKGYDVIKIHRM